MNRHLICAAALCASLFMIPALAHAQDIPVPPAASAQSESIGKTMQTSKQANLRKLPSTKSVMLDQLPKGTKLTILSTVQSGSEIWARVRVQRDGTEGYMLMSLVAPTPTPTPTPVLEIPWPTDKDAFIEVEWSRGDRKSVV